MTTQPTRRLLTVDEYHRMGEAGILSEDDRVELIRGEIFAMSPIGSQHAACVNRMNALLMKMCGENAIVSVQNPISVNRSSEPEPDIALLKPSDDFYADHLPTADDVLLVIEVADSSLQHDREVKLSLYAEAGIPEYWIVNLEAGELEVYRSPLDDRYQYREIVLPDKQVSLSSLDLTLTPRQLTG